MKYRIGCAPPNRLRDWAAKNDLIRFRAYCDQCGYVVLHHRKTLPEIAANLRRFGWQLATTPQEHDYCEVCAMDNAIAEEKARAL